MAGKFSAAAWAGGNSPVVGKSLASMEIGSQFLVKGRRLLYLVLDVFGLMFPGGLILFGGVSRSFKGLPPGYGPPQSLGLPGSGRRSIFIRQ